VQLPQDVDPHGSLIVVAGGPIHGFLVPLKRDHTHDAPQFSLISNEHRLSTLLQDSFTNRLFELVGHQLGGAGKHDLSGSSVAAPGSLPQPTPQDVKLPTAPGETK
jgi:hypothetical protein